MQRVNLLGLPRDALIEFFAELGEKPYRAEQLMKWIYHHYVIDFDAMSNISKKLRERLKTIAEITPPGLVPLLNSSDGTTKWRVEAEGSSDVEAVLIPEEGRATLCVSSQYGCALDCSFCATGKQGYAGNLTAAAIVGQVWQVNAERRDDPITNVVFMGMGEPLLNFAAVTDAMNVMMDDFAFGISKRRVTISTAGVVPKIYDLAEASDVSLAVSLHAPTDELRNELVPINRKYGIESLMTACRHYIDGLGKKRTVTIEYTLIDGVNDSPDDARALVEVLGDLRCKVNLIPFNPFPGTSYKRPSNNRIRRFQTVLLEAGLPAMLRTTRGDDIAAACGQLVGRVEDRTRRAERYILRSAATAAP